MKLERELTDENCEMFFADTVLLVEGPTERIVLPELARHLERDKQPVGPHDFDKNNVAVIATGGKDNFLIYAQVLDSLAIPNWILADRDNMKDAIKPLAKYRGLALGGGEANFDKDNEMLAGKRIVVLKQGEFEDYYSPEVLAEALGISVDEVNSRLQERTKPDTRENLLGILEILLKSHASEIGSGVPLEKKELKAWYDQAIENYRKSHPDALIPRKTSAIVEGMFPGGSKPRIALKIAKAMVETGHIPFSGLIRAVAKTHGQQQEK